MKHQLDRNFGINPFTQICDWQVQGLIILLYIPAEMYGDQQRRAEERRITVIVTICDLQQAEDLNRRPSRQT